MVTVRVLRLFYDLVERCDRLPGEAFEATEERAAYIDAKLPGYIAYGPSGASTSVPDGAEAQEPEEGATEAASGATRPQADLSALTNPQLKALCDERGIAVPKRARKAELIELLS